MPTHPDHSALLYGATCPACGGDMPRGSIRYNGFEWQHKDPDADPQAGHHTFDPAAVEWAKTDEHTPRRVECQACGYSRRVTGGVRSDRITAERSAKSARAGHISAGCPEGAVEIVVLDQLQLDDVRGQDRR